MRRWAWLCAVAWVGVAVAGGQEQVYPCYRAPSAIRVDGKLDDAAWAALPEAEGFWVPGLDRFAVARPTAFRLGWDDTHLYLGVRCSEPKAEQLEPRYANDGKPLYFDNSVELFVMPRRPRYFRIAVNAAGAREGPSLYKGAMHAREEVEAACASAAAIGPKAWTAELKVPLAAFGPAPKPGAVWRFNLCRNVRIPNARDDRFTSWARLPRVHWHLFDEFAAIRFLGDRLTPPEAQAAARTLNREFAAARPRLQHAALSREALEAEARRVEALPSLCLAKGMKTEGSLRYIHDVFRGKEHQRHQVPPHDLVLVWPQPVTLDTVLARWHDEKTFATHYGLEYWDAAQGGYRLLLEERDNRSPVSLHRFAPVTTKQVRFTVFAHPVSYHALAIRHFGLYRAEAADASTKP